MLFYVSLGVACIVAAAVCLWLVRSISEVGKAAYRTILPSAQQQRTDAKLAHLNTGLGKTPNPWGWSGTGGARHANILKGGPQVSQHPHSHRTDESDSKVPWGWPGSDGHHASDMHIISDAGEKSVAFDTVRNLMDSDHAKPDQEVDWPYRKDPVKPKIRQERFVGNSVHGAAKGDKPWGW